MFRVAGKEKNYVETRVDNVEAQTHVLLLQVFHLVYRCKIHRNLRLQNYIKICFVCQSPYSTVLILLLKPE